MTQHWLSGLDGWSKRLITSVTRPRHSGPARDSRRLASGCAPSATSLSRVDQLHHLLGVALAGCSPVWKCLVDAKQVIHCELHIHGAGILFQVLSPLGSRDWNDVFALRQYPRKGQLGRCAFFFFCKLLNFGDEIDVLLEVLALKP